MDWGAWGASLPTPTTSNPNPPVNVASLDMVVIGKVTQNLGQLTSIGAVNYSGVMAGKFNTLATAGTTSTFQTGSFTAGVNIANRTFTDFDGSIGQFRFGFHGGTSQFAPSGAATTGQIAVTNLGGASFTAGSISSALFGASAENIGGGFAIGVAANSTAPASTAAGIFVGAR